MIAVAAPRPRKSTRRLLAETALGVALLMVGLGTVERNLRIGIVEQEIVCLPGIAVVLYLLDAVMPERGAIYAFHPPEMEHELDVFPPDIVFVKRAAALPGDVVTVSASHGVSVNGEVVVEGLPLAARLGLTIAELERTFTVGPGEVLMLGETENSIDGRYFGPIRADLQGIGKGWALW